ncbi:MAG: S1C family serine protease [bacterium]|jgi:S1-C subfamily serine protease
MKHRLNTVVLLFCAGAFSTSVYAQGDYAFYQVWKDYAPTVYSIAVEIPQEVILKHYQQEIKKLRDLQASASDLINDGSGEHFNFQLLEHMIIRHEQYWNLLKTQMLNNNRIRGAGFAIDPSHMVTVSTVIKDATLGGEITVMRERERHKVTIKGIDNWTGIAVLEATEPVFSSYVDLTQVKQDYLLTVASFILSIQRPYDLPASPFNGIIGGFDRTFGENALFRIERYIQTDIDLYPGCEGSPLFSPTGHLVGMLVKDYGLGNAPMLSFAIPADIIADSALSILVDGKRERGEITGMHYQLAMEGLVVTDVEANTLAQRAGFREGDIIVGINDERFSQVLNLHFKILSLRPNMPIQVEVRRGKELKRIQVKTNIRKEM